MPRIKIKMQTFIFGNTSRHLGIKKKPVSFVSVSCSSPEPEPFEVDQLMFTFLLNFSRTPFSTALASVLKKSKTINVPLSGKGVEYLCAQSDPDPGIWPMTCAVPLCTLVHRGPGV